MYMYSSCSLLHMPFFQLLLLISCCVCVGYLSVSAAGSGHLIPSPLAPPSPHATQHAGVYLCLCECVYVYISREAKGEAVVIN